MRNREEAAMRARRRDERGDTLIEIILTVIIIGLVTSALFSSFTTASLASNRGRNLATADATLRNAAEAVKQAVRRDCIDGGTNYTVVLTAPGGFSAATVPPGPSHSCPPIIGSTSTQAPTLGLLVAGPNGATKSMTIVVRSP